MVCWFVSTIAQKLLNGFWRIPGRRMGVIIPITTGMYLDKETDCGFFYFSVLKDCEIQCFSTFLFISEESVNGCTWQRLADLGDPVSTREFDWMRMKETVGTLAEVRSAQSVHQNPLLCFSLLSRSRRHCVGSLCFTATRWQRDTVLAVMDKPKWINVFSILKTVKAWEALKTRCAI